MKVTQYNSQNNASTKIDTADMNSPRRELSNGGLKSAVAPEISWEVADLELLETTHTHTSTKVEPDTI